jgi:signal transduction histidine kinase
VSRARPSSGASRRVRRTVTVAAPVIALVAVVAIGAAVALLLTGRVPDREASAFVVPVLVGMAVAALAFGPFHRRLRATLLRAVRGERLLPEEAVERFGDRATRGLSLDELLRQLAESLLTTLALESVVIWTSAGDRMEPAMAVPSRPVDDLVLTPGQVDGLVRTSPVGPAWLELWAPELLDGRADDAPPTRAVPAVHSDALVGMVVLRRPHGADPFDDADDRTLKELGRRLGVVLHNRELDAALQETLADLRASNEQLQASRMRIVTAADSERRRIERDLHDGAQQHLVAIAVNARLARDAMADDPAGAAELLDAVSADLRAAVQEVRSLAHGIYPPLLVDGGIGPALRAAAQRAAQPVEVRAFDARIAPEAEAAVYFCCMEALQNAAKHAPRATVLVEIDLVQAVDGPEAHFRVSDDGPGFDPTTPPGHGLQNMADRAGALGGSVTWSSTAGGGTTVEGRVPSGTAGAG